MMRFIGTVVGILLAVPVPGHGQDFGSVAGQQQRMQNVQTQQVGTVIHSSQIDRSQWKLTDADWDRYDEVMRGPRRFWSPGVDPLTILGSEARSDAERLRYAEMLVEQERSRAEGELALVRAYSDAWVRLYGSEPLLDNARLGVEEVVPFDAADRIAFFLDSKCVSCTNIIERVTTYLKTTPWPGLDLYFLGDDEDAIQHWTAAAGIPLDMVESGQVSINYDDGVLAHLQRTSTPEFPAAYRRRGDSEFHPVELSYLLRADLYGIDTGTSATQRPGGWLDQVKGWFQ